MNGLTYRISHLSERLHGADRRVVDMPTATPIREADIKAALPAFRAMAGSVRRNRNAVTACLESGNRQCVVCGGKAGMGRVVRVEAAHIIPLEEGGADEPSNMRCLCQRMRRSLARGALPYEIGCHVLLDRFHVWSRAQVESCTSDGDHSSHNETLGHQRNKWEDAITEADRVEIHLINRHWIAAVREVFALPEPSRSERIVDVAVALRKRKGDARQRWKAICNVIEQVGTVYEKSVDVKVRSRIEYEVAMIMFQKREFRRAVSLMRRAPLVASNRGKSKAWINHAQACVAEFEAARRNGSDVGVVIENLEDLLTWQFDMTPGQFTAAEGIPSFVIDAHLHLARMYATIGETSKAHRMLQNALSIRHQGPVEPSVSWAINFAIGEVAVCEEHFDLALERLGRAAWLVGRLGMKDYENLEIILQLLSGLPNVPPSYIGAVERLAKRLEEHVAWLGTLNVSYAFFD